MTQKQKKRSRIVNLLLVLVMVVCMIPLSNMTAYASMIGAWEIPVSDASRLAYYDNLAMYYKYNNNLYKVVFNNLTNTKEVCFCKVDYDPTSALRIAFRGEGDTETYGAWLKNVNGETFRLNELPTQPGDSVELYPAVTNDYVNKNDIVVTITCLPVQDPIWDWSGRVAYADFISTDNSTKFTVKADVSSSVQAAPICTERGTITYTATVTVAGTQYSSTNVVDGEIGPHNPTYSAVGNVITEGCSNGCGHNATATLSVDSNVSLKYNGSAIQPLIVEYSSGWQGGNLDITYQNNINASTNTSRASGSITKEGLTITQNFSIEPKEVNIGWETSILNPYTYTGSSLLPTANVTNLEAGDECVLTTEVVENDEGAGINAGTWTARVAALSNNNYKLPENGENVTATFSIEPKEVNISWETSILNPYTYTGSSLLPTANVTNLEAGDECVLTTEVVENDEGAGINAGTWTARVAALSNNNYKLPENGENVTATFRIDKASQEYAPNAISAMNETIDGKADGKIIGVNDTMEYRKEGQTEYTAISGTEVKNLADGTYYVRYAANANYNASDDIRVVIAAGRNETGATPTPGINNPDTPDTGDNTNIWRCITVLVVCAMGLCGAIIYDRKKKQAK